MKSRDKISLSFACNEDVTKMKIINDKTRFCSQCNKNVFDFRDKNNLKLSEQVCGIYSLNQINKIRRKNFIENLTKPISLISLLGISFFPLNIEAQQNTSSIQTNNNLINDSIFKVTGVVTDKENGSPIPLAKIDLLQNNISIQETLTDSEGQFSLSIDTTKYSLEQLEITINVYEYENDTVKNLQKGNLIIELESNVQIEDVYITVGYRIPILPDSTIIINQEEKKKIKRKKP
jgi:hypothetical protein